MIGFCFEKKLIKRTYWTGISSELPAAVQGVTGILEIKHRVERKLSEKGENNKRNCKQDWISRNKFTEMKLMARLQYHY